MASTCGAFVGGNTVAASEYHSNDFDWEDLRAEVEALSNEQQQPKETHSCNGLTTKPWIPDPRSWEKFHARDNATARFYKERRYLLLEFPSLADAAQPQHVLEIGCGCGSSLLPVLKANAAARVTATDLSPTAVRLFCDAAERAGIAADRYTAFPCDAADPEIGKRLLAELCAGLEADSVLLIFTLAALCPEGQHVMLRNAFKALRHGGQLLIRDHGLYDITHLRMTPDRQLGRNLYRRGDGTLCYFFSTQDLASKAEAAGFEAVECKYVCVRLMNRKKQFEMRREYR
ncbi:g7077 [Coccomyxa elongata]